MEEVQTAMMEVRSLAGGRPSDGPRRVDGWPPRSVRTAPGGVVGRDPDVVRPERYGTSPCLRKDPWIGRREDPVVGDTFPVSSSGSLDGQEDAKSEKGG